MKNNPVVGREKEQLLLSDIYQRAESSFVAVYGRRRVGKTHLIREQFSTAGGYLEITGTKDGSMGIQLQNFIDGFSLAFAGGLPLATPKSWREAFTLLTEKIREKAEANQKVVVFLDELPWLASPRSGLVQSLDYFWNRHWGPSKNVILVACGSAASWMLDKLINAKGGLYNRITDTIHLKPFNLLQTERFLASLGYKYKRKQIIQLFMVLGGIPFYLKQLKRSQSVIQNINRLCFTDDGLLYGEFDRLFQSLFKNGHVHEAIVRYLAEKPNGIAASDIANKLGKSNSGRLSQKLDELVAAGFIRRSVPLGKTQRDSVYRIVDEYSLFYAQWIDQWKRRGDVPSDANYWLTQSKSSKGLIWAGLAFERVCLKHIVQIKEALGISNVGTLVGDWRYVPRNVGVAKRPQKQGAQIDIVIEREDGVITLCEIKYYESKLSVDKAMASAIANKVRVFEQHYKSDKMVTVALIAANGCKNSIWTEELIDHTIDSDALFIY